MKKYNKSVFKSFSLITQLGFSMIAPIALCVAVGVIIDNRFHTLWTIPLMILGMLAGGRNVYMLVMSAIENDKNATKSSFDKNEDGEDWRQ